jgi:apolipoprotein N-acyltransferase
MSGLTPYSYLGDKPIIIALLLLLIGLLINSMKIINHEKHQRHQK